MGHSISVQAQPYGFVAGIGNGRVSVIDLNIHQEIGNLVVQSGGSGDTWGRGITMTPGRDKVYMSFRNANVVSVIDVDTTYSVFPSVSTTISMPTGAGPYGMDVLADGSKVYVSNELNGTASVIDVATNTIDTTFAIGGRAIGMVIAQDGSKFFAPCRENGVSNWTAVYSIPDHTLITNIPGVSEPYGIALSFDGTTAYVANRGADLVQIIDVATNTVTGTVSVGNQPTGITVSTDDSKVYVVNSADDDVSVIDVSGATPSVIATVEVGTALGM